MNPWPPLACLIFALVAGAGGYIKGRVDNEARHVAINADAVLAGLKQAAIDAKAQREMADELQAQASRNDQLLRDYENAVFDNSGADACRPSTDSLRQFMALTAAAKARAGQ